MLAVAYVASAGKPGPTPRAHRPSRRQLLALTPPALTAWTGVSSAWSSKGG